MQLTQGPYVVQIWSCNHPKSASGESSNSISPSARSTSALVRLTNDFARNPIRMYLRSRRIDMGIDLRFRRIDFQLQLSKRKVFLCFTVLAEPSAAATWSDTPHFLSSSASLGLTDRFHFKRRESATTPWEFATNSMGTNSMGLAVSSYRRDQTVRDRARGRESSVLLPHPHTHETHNPCIAVSLSLSIQGYLAHKKPPPPLGPP